MKKGMKKSQLIWGIVHSIFSNESGSMKLESRQKEGDNSHAPSRIVVGSIELAAFATLFESSASTKLLLS